jgi:hypothetical protein
VRTEIKGCRGVRCLVCAMEGRFHLRFTFRSLTTPFHSIHPGVLSTFVVWWESRAATSPVRRSYEGKGLCTPKARAASSSGALSGGLQHTQPAGHR